MTAADIQLIVGLGNPGPEYANTRHNVGFWFVERLCEQTRTPLSAESKFKGHAAVITLHGKTIRALLPMNYMNRSGQAVAAICQFYKIQPNQILVIHDELDLPPGCARIKLDGGDGGHNGLKDIIRHLGTKQFYRLRLGIGRPGDRDIVADYVLHKPSLSDKERILTGIDHSLDVLPDILAGNISKAMNVLHTLTK